MNQTSESNNATNADALSEINETRDMLQSLLERCLGISAKGEIHTTDVKSVASVLSAIGRIDRFLTKRHRMVLRDSPISVLEELVDDGPHE